MNIPPGMNKRGDIKTFLLIAIGIVATLIVVSLIIFLINPKDNAIRKIAENLNIIKNNSSSENQNDGLGIIQPPDASGEGSGGGGSKGSSGSGGASESCTRQAYHSVINLQKYTDCNSYDGEICIDKSVTCSAEIHNDDSTLSGDFRVELSFVEDGKSNGEAVKKVEKTFNIATKSFAQFEEYTRIQSTGVDGAANKLINCAYSILSTPSESC